MRDVRIRRGYIKHAHGSVLVAFGDTKVICTANAEHGVPRFIRGRGRGWVTAEYGMLPGATHSRGDREAARGGQKGRTMEIQRLIGRSLRAAVDTLRLGERTVRVDCDVIQADGGTRTAAITGAAVALRDALVKIGRGPAFRQLVTSVSVGMWRGLPVLDLDYDEDSTAQTDMNIVRLASGGIVEIQGTGEGAPFSDEELLSLLALSRKGTDELLAIQKTAVAQAL